MKNNRLAVIAMVCSLVLASTESHAQTVVKPSGNAGWYYTIGGGDPFVYYHQSNKTQFSFGAGAEWSLMRSCQFDPEFGIADTFSNIKENVYGLSNNVLNSATAMFTGWGLSKIQENWPGLYDTLSKGLKDAKETFAVSVKNCRDIQGDLRNHRNPVDGWVSLSRESSWAKASLNGENPVESEKQIDQTAGDAGVQWVGDAQAGGVNQPPIHAVADTVKAGYDHLVGDYVPDVTGNGIPQVTGDANVARVFPTAADASKWTTAVVGERDIRTCVNCPKLKTRVGQGMRQQYALERKQVDKDLLIAIQAPHPTAAQLDKLNVVGMGVVVNEQVIQSLQEAPYDERMILANRLAAEIALGRAMEKALIARDLLNAGAQEPNIAVNGEAQNQIDLSRQSLQREIDNVLFESDVRSRVLTNAAGTLSSRGQQRDHSPSVMDYLRPVRQDPRVQEGGIAK